MSERAKAFGMPVLAALGIETKNVTGFSINCEVGETPTITVTTVLPQGLGEPAARVLRSFRIVHVDDVSCPAVDESVSLESLVRTTHRLVDSPE